MDKKFNYYPFDSKEPSLYNPFTTAEALRTCEQMSEWRAVDALGVGQTIAGTFGRWERIA